MQFVWLTVDLIWRYEFNISKKRYSAIAGMMSLGAVALFSKMFSGRQINNTNSLETVDRDKTKSVVLNEK